MLSLEGAIESVLQTLQMYPDDQGWYNLNAGFRVDFYRPLAAGGVSLKFFYLVLRFKTLNIVYFSPILLEIQRLGLSLIGCLITEKNLILGTENLLAKILVSSLQRFKDITELQTNVCASS